MLNFSQIVLLIGVLLFVRWAFAVFYRLYISPLKSIPGPRLWAMTSIPHDTACVKGIRHQALEELHEKYGPVVRISPTEVSFINAVVWRDVWGFRKNDVECPKTDRMERVNGFTGILDADRMDHRRFRRLLSHAFSESSLRNQEGRVLQHVDRLIEGLRQSSKEGPQDVTLWMHWTTFDIMGDLAFGESFKSLEAQKTHPWQQFLNDHIAAGVWSGIAERWGLIKFISVLTPQSLRDAVQEFYNLSSHMIEKRVKFGKDRGDFLDHILKHGVLTDDTAVGSDIKGMRHGELKSIASDLAIAGSETTATVLSGLWFYLLKYPGTLHKLTSEIRSLQCEEDITFANTVQLPYLNAVINEILRCFIPSPIPGGRLIPAGGVTVGDYFLPEGSSAFVAHYVAYRSNLHFARSKEFIPERWLPDRPKEFEHDDETGVFHPFAFGPRNCIGTHLAKAELRLIICKMLWHFDLKVPDSSPSDKEEFATWLDRSRIYFLWRKPPLMLSVCPR